MRIVVGDAIDVGAFLRHCATTPFGGGGGGIVRSRCRFAPRALVFLALRFLRLTLRFLAGLLFAGLSLGAASPALVTGSDASAEFGDFRLGLRLGGLFPSAAVVTRTIGRVLTVFSQLSKRHRFTLLVGHFPYGWVGRPWAGGRRCGGHGECFGLSVAGPSRRPSTPSHATRGGNPRVSHNNSGESARRSASRTGRRRLRVAECCNRRLAARGPVRGGRKSRSQRTRIGRIFSRRDK